MTTLASLSYEQLKAKVDEHEKPAHVAIIMDGNSRWAEKKGLRRLLGHREGLKTLKRLLDSVKELNIPFLSVYAFSRENWKRSKEEIDYLFRLFEEFFENEFKTLKDNKIRIIHSGLSANFSHRILNILNVMQQETADDYRYTLNLAIDYSGQSEIVETCKAIFRHYKENNLDINNLNEAEFAYHMYKPELPTVDLLIRTSGEMRISNFMLWQIAYSEIWFTDTLWPDFSKEEFTKAIIDFQQRNRRYGGR